MVYTGNAPAGGRSNEWYTPRYIFDAMGVAFDWAVAAPPDWRKTTFCPCSHAMSVCGLERPWSGFVWMNPPFSERRNGVAPWHDKFFNHGNGVMIAADRTSAPWWQKAAMRCDALLFIAGKPRFIRPDGTEGASPADGMVLFAAGRTGVQALRNAREAQLGVAFEK